MVTGGLGPTHDDVTRKCVVEYFKSELIVDNEVLSDIKKFFEVRGRILTPTNEDQARVPKISKTIRNPLGTAPGYWIEKQNKVFVCMPGVPYEMKNMIDSFVIRRLAERIEKDNFILTKNLLFSIFAKSRSSATPHSSSNIGPSAG